MRVIKRVLVIGGAGFIGLHTVNRLTDSGYEVVILDCLDPQVHEVVQAPPEHLENGVDFLYGDIRNKALLKKVVSEVDAIIHLASRVGVGQSMYEIERYIDVNTRGTAGLLDVLVNEEHDVKKLLVASSMSVYGEGKYRCEKCGIDVSPRFRSKELLEKGKWDHMCPFCSSVLTPVPTDEGKALMPTSIYGMSKRHQEEMCLLIGETYGIPTAALRYFNVYGPGQALTNPYTGCVAIFISRIWNNQYPIIFEDGKQLRDCVYVKDVANANILALEKNVCDYQSVNIGSGKPSSIMSIAETLITISGKNVKPLITGQYRVGDIRHCYADISRIKRIGFQPKHTLEQGLRETLNWASKNSSKDLLEVAIQQLKQHNLLK